LKMKARTLSLAALIFAGSAMASDWKEVNLGKLDSSTTCVDSLCVSGYVNKMLKTRNPSRAMQWAAKEHNGAYILSESERLHYAGILLDRKNPMNSAALVSTLSDRIVEGVQMLEKKGADRYMHEYLGYPDASYDCYKASKKLADSGYAYYSSLVALSKRDKDFALTEPQRAEIARKLVEQKKHRFAHRIYASMSNEGLDAGVRYLKEKGMPTAAEWLQRERRRICY
jgi:hypothetical protein